MAEGRKDNLLTLICILLTIFLDMLGYGIVLPVLPRLISDLTGGSNAEAAVLGGYLVFSYSLMQFLFGPALGNLSDRFGRRPIILIALSGLTIDYTIMGFSPNVAWLFVGHTIAGISGASVATATAYIADITPKEKRAQRFGLIVRLLETLLRRTRFERLLLAVMRRPARQPDTIERRANAPVGIGEAFRINLRHAQQCGAFLFR